MTASASAAAPSASAAVPEVDTTPTWQVDPVASHLSAAGLVRLCETHLGRATAALSELQALRLASDAELTWEATLGRIDRVSLEISMAAGFPELMAVTHPDGAVREAGKACRPKTTAFITELYLDPVLAAVVKRYADKKETLTGTRKRLLDDTLRELRRNGLLLPADGQKRLRELNDELSKLAQDFEANLADAAPSIEVEPRRLAGLPQSFLDAHPPGANGLVKLTTDYPDYFPIVQYCDDRSVARELNLLFDTRAASGNMPILDRVLELRREKAKLLGYASWADYAIEPRMAKTPQAVRDFLARAAKLVKAPAQRELAEFRTESKAHGDDPKAPLPSYERAYLEEKLRQKRYAFDSKKLSEYFEVGAVTEGLLTIVSKLYGVELVTDATAPTWHPEVRALDVLGEGNKKIGRIYLDLHPREGKFKHAAMFEIRPGVAAPDGAYVTPMSALVCNFPRSQPGAPALMSHSDVTTFFHEFGHALHHVFTQQALASYSGTNTARDFVEAPSQMFEEWTFQRETLDLFAKHHQTGEKIPQPLFDAMTRARAFGRALATERQISLATLDFEYHVRTEKFDTDAVLDDVMRRTQSFAFQPKTHFQATFGHLMGYDAGYYGYQWALALARDVLTRFQKEGWMNARTAADWRSRVLAQGAGEDERALVAAFLGRETNLDAYAAYLAGK